METGNEGALAGLGQSLEQILRHYGEPYFVRRDISVGGMPVAALAEMQLSEPKTLFGFSSPGLKLGESRAGEYLLFVLAEVLTEEVAGRMIALQEAARTELYRPEDDNAYTFFSVAALVNTAEPAAVKKLKRFRSPGGNQAGWTMTRLAAVCPGWNKAWCNPEGKELGKLLLNRLK